MANPFGSLFDTSAFPPRWQCGVGWQQEPFWGWLHISSDVAIWAAYMAIPLALAYFLRRRPDLPFPRVMWLFVAFIFACGTGHLIDAALFYWPAYRFSGLVKFTTAVVSWATVAALLPLLPRAFSFRSPLQLEQLVGQRTEELQALTDKLTLELERGTELAQELGTQVSRCQLALRAGRMGTWDWDLVTGLIQIDSVEGKLLGTAENRELIDLETFLSLVEPEDREELQAVLRRSTTHGEEYSHEFRIVLPDGQHRWLAGRGEVELNDSGKPVRMRGVNYDVTDMKLSDQHLRISEQRFRDLADNIAQFAWMTDETGAIVWYNRRWFDYTGSTLEAMRGWGWQSMHHPDHVDRVTAHFQQSLASGAPWEDTFPLRGKNGTYRWFLSQAMPIRDEQGRVMHWFGTNTDITEQRAADRSLAQAHAQLKSIVDAAADVIVTLDDQTRVLSVNSAIEQVFGYRPSEVISLPIADLIAWTDVPADADSSEFTNMVIGKQKEAVGRRKDGTTVPLEVSVSVSNFGKRKLYAAIIRDTSERKRAEETLRIGLRAIEFATNGILITDALQDDNPIIYVNPAFEQLTGYKSAEALGKNCRFLQGKDTNEESVSQIRTALERRQECHVTILNYRRDGSRFWNDLHLAPVEDDSGRVSHFIGVQSDITGRIRYEQRLRESQEQADTANRAKSEFLANMSHEIRTPLTAILGCADSLFRQIEDPDPKDAVRMIRDQGKLLLGILNDVLDLSKIEAGKLEIRIETCDPVKVIGDVNSLMHSQAVEKGLELRVRYLTRIPDRVQTDPLRVRQVLLNLVSNAIKFTAQGHVEIQVSCRPEEGILQLQFAVEDTGIGIPADRIETIFEAFAQNVTTLSLKTHGTGLGLTICQRLVQMLGGEMRVSSMVGQGSRFVVQLPVGRFDPALMKDPDEVTRTASLRDSHMLLDVFIPCRVLIAEDTRAIQFMMSRMVKDVVTGYAVAENGQQAIEAVERASQGGVPFDVILMDMQMPIMNGFEATRKLREMGYMLPVIALTAGAMAGDREKCLAAGCTDYLPKPVDRAELLEKLEQLTSGD